MVEPLTAADLFTRALEARLRHLHVCMPMKVTKYDAARDAVDVQPQIQRMVPGSDPDDDEPTFETLVEIRAVPLVRPRGNGMVMTVPVAVDDYVLVVFSERDIGQWLKSGSISNPGDQRTHSLAAGMAIPGIFPTGEKPASISTTNIEIGTVDGAFRVAITPSRMEVDGAADAAALASKVDALEQALNNHTHTTTAVVGGGGAVGVIGPSLPVSNQAPTASAVLKVGS